MVNIRRATPDDVPAVHNLLRGLAEHQNQPARPEIPYLIAERDGWNAVGASAPSSRARRSAAGSRSRGIA
ncbi:hypothetical protein AB0G05_17345 [Nonomuraea wenchangensis]